MKPQILSFALYAMTIHLTGSTLTPAIVDLNAGEPRTVRLIYFLPNDRAYRTEVVQRMKDEIRFVQDFYAEEMQSHGYGNITFQVETDIQGDPVVHRFDGQQPDNHYSNKTREEIHAYVFDEIAKMFDMTANIYFVVIDKSEGEIALGSRLGKNSGNLLTFGGFEWKTLAHELGHTFGLQHNFNDGSYIMSYGYASYGPEIYGPGQSPLSAYSAKFLAAHPYFNVNVQLEDTAPVIELISPLIYPAESKSVPIKLKVSDFEGLHQVILYVITSRNLHPARGFPEVKAWHGLAGDKDTIIEFDYNGVMPTDDMTNLSTPRIHPILVEVVDINGNIGRKKFTLEEKTLPDTITTQQEMEIEVNIPDLELRTNIYDILAYLIGKSKTEPITRQDMTHIFSSAPRNVHDLTGLEFAINLRRLWLDRNHITDVSAISELPHLKYLNLDENNITDVSTLVPGLSRLNNLELHLNRNAISDISSISELTNLSKLYLGYNYNISDISAVTDMTSLTRLDLSVNNISDISPVAGLTNLEWLWLGHNPVSDISPVAGLTNLRGLYVSTDNLSNLSPVAGLTNLISLSIYGSSLSDISALANLTRLQWLRLTDHQISDISALAGLIHLTKIRMWNNLISDISALQNLIYLEELALKNNSISDISALADLTRLNYLNLQGNNISDISALANLIHLEDLNLTGNNISNISVLAGLTEITDLDLGGNKISDISALTHLIFLKDLRINGNSISDISALVENMGVGDRDHVDLRSNPLSYKSLYTYIPILQERGVYVMFDADRMPPTDINRDGVVNILDLIQVANNLGEEYHPADVNGDKIVNVMDLVMVASELGEIMTAPSLSLQNTEIFATEEVQQWINEAKAIRVKNTTIERGIVALEHLLAFLTPRETELLANYPNPFNPETWIPYRLAENAFVMLTIYDLSGHVVRTLDVGHRVAAAYENRSKAVYWDGRNDLGEQVASGVYFYHLSADEYSATRRMVILK